MSDTKKSCLLYGRYSNDAQTTERENKEYSEQTTLGKQWAEYHGYSVRKSFFDPAISGFRAKNQERQWANMIKELRPNESILVRHMDRIGRNNSMELGGMLYAVINAGHNIITWLDGKIYTKDNLDDFGTTLELQIKAMLNHQESVKKQILQNSFIEKWIKQLDAGEKIKINKIPFWLEYINKQFIVKNGAKEIINRIFEMSKNGIGSIIIARTMIQENVPVVYTNNKKISWNDTMVRFILCNKSTIGVFTYKGKEYPNYYPRVISDELFYSVQNRLIKTPNFGGRPTKSKINTNLFTSLLKCKHCGSSMNNCGGDQNNNKKRYLCCQNGRLGNGCKFKVIDYYNVENSFLIMFSEFDFVNLFSNKTEIDKETESSLNGKLDNAIKQINKYSSLIENDDNPSQVLISKLKEYELQKNNLLKDVEIFNVQTKSDNVNIDKIKEVQKEVYSNISNPDYRVKLKAFFREIIEKIEIDAAGKSYTIHYKNSDKVIKIELQKDNFAVIDSDNRRDLYKYGINPFINAINKSKPFHIVSNYEANDIDNPLSE